MAIWGGLRAALFASPTEAHTINRCRNMLRSLVILWVIVSVSSCASVPAPDADEEYTASPDLGVLWVKHAAEYRALSLQVYQAATAALPRFIDDRSWSALPEDPEARDLPPAVILDVDETTVSNVDFQLYVQPPFTNRKLEQWNRDYVAIPVPGVVDFVNAARDAGVAVFFVTNRPCIPVAENSDACPEKRTTLGDLEDIGIETDAEHVLMSREQGWNREKSTRRAQIAKTHRVIMLIGDDLGDFLPCVRDRAYPPCTETATAASRDEQVRRYSGYWGNGWYVLPNPMHGSWTSHID